MPDTIVLVSATIRMASPPLGACSVDLCLDLLPTHRRQVQRVEFSEGLPEAFGCLRTSLGCLEEIQEMIRLSLPLWRQGAILLEDDFFADLPPLHEATSGATILGGDAAPVLIPAGLLAVQGR
jgi:hypothetical protein